MGQTETAIEPQTQITRVHMGERLEDFQQLCSSEYGLDPISSLLIIAAITAGLDLMIESGHHPFWEHLSYALVRNGQPGVGYAGQQHGRLPVDNFQRVAGRALDIRPGLPDDRRELGL